MNGPGQAPTRGHVYTVEEEGVTTRGSRKDFNIKGLYCYCGSDKHPNTILEYPNHSKGDQKPVRNMTT